MMVAMAIDSARLVGFLLTVGAKGVLLLSAVGLLVIALRWSAAATRHWLWFLGMAGLLVLPAIQLVVPSWTIALPLWAPDAARWTPVGWAAPAPLRLVEVPTPVAVAVPVTPVPVPAPMAVPALAPALEVPGPMPGAPAPALEVPAPVPAVPASSPELTARLPGVPAPAPISEVEPTSPAALGNRRSGAVAISSATVRPQVTVPRPPVQLGQPETPSPVASADIRSPAAPRAARPARAVARAPEAPTIVIPSRGSPRAVFLAAPGADIGDFAGQAATWPVVLLVIWGTGTTILLASLLGSLGAVARLDRRSPEFLPGRIPEVAEEIRRWMGIDAPVRILRGDPDTMPMSWGVLRPAILLPAGAEEWHRRRLLSVLLHEFSHVRRRDCLSQIVAEVTLALHWFNPLAWLAVRRLRVEREHACDEAVIAAGARPSDYAEELLSLAQGFQPVSWSGPVAVAMARPVHLGGRIRSILRNRRTRPLSAGRALVATGLAAIMVGGLAAFTPVPSGGRPEAIWATTRVSLEEIPRRQIRGSNERGFAVGDRASWLALSQDAQQLSCGTAPDGWQRTSIESDDDSHRLLWSRPGCEVDVRVEGDIEFTSDFLDISNLGSGALLRIQEDDRGTERRIDVSAASDGAPLYRYRVDGEDRPFDTAARAWFGELLVQVFRRGGFMADERVAWLLREGGVDGVLRELEMLQSDFVFASYSGALLEQAEVSDAQAVGLLERSRTRVDSDHYMAEILQAVATGHLDSDPVLATFIAASRTIGSDHYRSEVLSTALGRDDLPTVRVAELLASAVEIDSDHYLAQLLESVATRYALEPELRGVYLGAVESIGSDHYRSEVLSTLLDRNDLDAGELSVVLQAANGVDSDHYRTEILEGVAARALASDALTSDYVSAASGIDSDHYRSEALGYLLERETLSAAQLADLIRATAEIDSDHYKADLLLDVTGRYRLEGPTRAAFLDALNSIGSSQYRGRVAEAFLRGEQGGV
jgi:beta-lactamase regulating signal transducer with metallopeptidase domain